MKKLFLGLLAAVILTSCQTKSYTLTGVQSQGSATVTIHPERRESTYNKNHLKITAVDNQSTGNVDSVVIPPGEHTIKLICYRKQRTSGRDWADVATDGKFLEDTKDFKLNAEAGATYEVSTDTTWRENIVVKKK